MFVTNSTLLVSQLPWGVIARDKAELQVRGDAGVPHVRGVINPSEYDTYTLMAGAMFAVPQWLQ